MIEIHFGGRFQCRLATDEDAYDDARGQVGWTFAMPGEPDLDRIIRFHDAVAPRSRTPAIGVTVEEVRVGGAAQPGSPLLGARVELLEGAVFEGRNGAIASSAHEPIAPFTLAIAAAGAAISGHDPINLTLLAERQRRAAKGLVTQSQEVLDALGVADPLAYRRERRELLEVDLAVEPDATRRAALAQRIAQLEDDPAAPDIRANALGFQVRYDFTLRGPVSWSDPAGVLGAPPAAGAVWRMRFWMGGWDADALCGFVRGSLGIG